MSSAAFFSDEQGKEHGREEVALCILPRLHRLAPCRVWGWNSSDRTFSSHSSLLCWHLALLERRAADGASVGGEKDWFSQVEYEQEASSSQEEVFWGKKGNTFHFCHLFHMENSTFWGWRQYQEQETVLDRMKCHVCVMRAHVSSFWNMPSSALLSSPSENSVVICQCFQSFHIWVFEPHIAGSQKSVPGDCCIIWRLS